MTACLAMPDNACHWGPGENAWCAKEAGQPWMPPTHDEDWPSENGDCKGKGDKEPKWMKDVKDWIHENGDDPEVWMEEHHDMIV